MPTPPQSAPSPQPAEQQVEVPLISEALAAFLQRLVERAERIKREAKE